jgi:hypothetical protein
MKTEQIKNKDVVWSIKLYCYKCNKQTDHETILKTLPLGGVEHRCRICQTKRMIRK